MRRVLLEESVIGEFEQAEPIEIEVVQWPTPADPTLICRFRQEVQTIRQKSKQYKRITSTRYTKVKPAIHGRVQPAGGAGKIHIVSSIIGSLISGMVMAGPVIFTSEGGSPRARPRLGHTGRQLKNDCSTGSKGTFVLKGHKVKVWGWDEEGREEAVENELTGTRRDTPVGLLVTARVEGLDFVLETWTDQRGECAIPVRGLVEQWVAHVGAMTGTDIIVTAGTGANAVSKTCVVTRPDVLRILAVPGARVQSE